MTWGGGVGWEEGKTDCEKGYMYIPKFKIEISKMLTVIIYVIDF